MAQTPQAVENQIGTSVKSEKPPQQRQSAPSIKPGTKTAQIMEVVVDYLKKKGGRAKSGELLKVVVERGVHIGGKVPNATMASYLSNADVLDNLPGQGYGLREWSQKEKDPSSGDDGSLFN